MPKETAAKTVWDLPRNDVQACVRFYESHGVTSEEMAVMLRLQDDDTELLAIAADWKQRK